MDEKNGSVIAHHYEVSEFVQLANVVLRCIDRRVRLADEKISLLVARSRDRFRCLSSDETHHNSMKFKKGEWL